MTIMAKENIDVNTLRTTRPRQFQNQSNLLTFTRRKYVTKPTLKKNRRVRKQEKSIRYANEVAKSNAK